MLDAMRLPDAFDRSDAASFGRSLLAGNGRYINRKMTLTQRGLSVIGVFHFYFNEVMKKLVKKLIQNSRGKRSTEFIGNLFAFAI